MNIKSETREISSSLENSANQTHIRDLQEMCDSFRNELEFQAKQGTVDADTYRACKYQIALWALRIQQQGLPLLAALASEMLAATDATAVRAVCAPRKMYGQPGGAPVHEIKSAFDLPAGYETVAAVITGKVKGAAVAVGAVLAAGVFRR